MRCPRCGKQMPPGADSCPYCGYEINLENLMKHAFPAGEDGDSPGSLSPRTLTIITAIVIIGAIVAAYCVLS